MPGLAFKDAFSVDTFTGNGNGVIDFNECNEIMVVLVNNSRTTVSNVSALIFTTNAGDIDFPSRLQFMEIFRRERWPPT